MNLNGDPNTDDYFVTAVHIFKYCGAESTETLRVDALMDKFAPFIKTNKAEYSYLKSLLDPEENNPEVSVLTLASVLNKYSENQKIKADLDESFNLKNGQGPHDSDSGISTEAVHIFKYCGAESTETLRVDALMDKFAPFIKTNKAEYSYLKSLLDPEENNPEVSVLTLASVLNKYSENQKIKADLDESFNLKNGQGPHDSDSGISTEGFQLLEDLQCELKEKAHLAQQLRSQLDFTDRQHEEQLASVTAERDSLLAHLNLLREENISLSHVKRDYEETCDRLCCSERALDEATRDLDVTRKRARVLVEQVAALESEKVILQELLNKSKEECHRINEMYASRQSALLEECESLRGQHADLASRLQDHDHYMQQLIKEKVQSENIVVFKLQKISLFLYY
ncbi:hypothetical protein RR48_04097 [Papilio machaon]|uniref:Uncharacterized protein n=1 Tax=Papilio machaon TaxID=76193 RepID=A0A0N1ICN0_PAPMA|nr:hypothetical protein RR48_04097 [Papilio machaon]